MGYNAPLRTLAYAPATFRPLIARMTLSPGAGPSIPSRAKSTIATLLTDSPIKTSFPTPSTSTRLSNSRPAAILPLPRPLGVPKPPSSAPETWSQLTDKLLDEDRHNAKRKALYIPPHFLGLYRADGGARLKEAKQGYFHDYNQARKELGAKLWNAPPVLIREDRALYFPNIAGSNLNSEKTNTTELLTGRTTLLSILNTRLSEEHAQTFIRPVLQDQEGKPGFSFLQINHQPNPLKSMLVSFFTSSLRRTIPQSRWGTYLLARGEWSEIDIYEPLGIENKILGYVFLIDANCRVRWAGCGAATEKEVQSLRAATAVLLNRMNADGA